MNSIVVWEDEISRTVADKTHLGVYVSYEEKDEDTGLWVPLQRTLIPTDKYKAFSKFLGK